MKYILYIFNGLNRTRRTAAGREFRPLTSNLYYGRSDRQIPLKREPLGSYRKELSNEYKRLKSNGRIWNYVQIKFEKGRCKCSSMTVYGNRLKGP